MMKKKKKIEKANFATLEIDLSDWLKKDVTRFNRNDLEDAIIQDTNNKRWIYSPKIKVMKDRFLKGIYIILQKADNDKKKARKEEMHRENRIAEIIEQRKALDSLHHKEILILYKEDLKRDMRIRILLGQLGVNKKIDKKINCCNVYIPGEQVFDCDRRVWQTYILHYILKKVREFNVGDLIDYVKKELDSCIEPTLSTQFYRRNISTLADVVRTYMFHLYQFGVITPKVYSKRKGKQLQIYTPISDYMWANFKSLYYNVTTIPFKIEYPCVRCGEVTTRWECMMSYKSCLCKSCFDEVGIPN